MEVIGSADGFACRARQGFRSVSVFGAVGAGASGAAARADMFVAVRALARYRMLMWTLDRIGIRTPALYAAAARHAARVGVLEGHRGFDAQSQFQGALAMVARMASVRTLDVAAAEKLIERLVALSVTDAGRYGGAVAAWLRDDVARAIRPADSVEAAVLAAMSARHRATARSRA
jgi:hypothetical protein